MEIALSNKEKNLLLSLMGLHSEAAGIPDFNEKILSVYQRLMDAHYCAIVKLSPLDGRMGFSNNPLEFETVYNEVFLHGDELSNRVFTHPRRIHFSNELDWNDRHLISWYEECCRLRPTGAWFYDPLMYNGQFSGMLAVTKPDLNYRFSEKELFLNNMVKRVFESGNASLLEREKINLTGRSGVTEALFYAFLMASGEWYIPENSRVDILPDALGAEWKHPDQLRSHPVIQSVLRDLETTDGPVKRVSGHYEISGVVRGDFYPDTTRRMMLFSIRKSENPYNYRVFGEAFELTGRELEIVGHIAGGLTSRQISENLCIAEGTVNRHIANIYEKTSVSSRTLLLLKLSAVNF